MRYNESITKVLTTPAQWREWLSTIIADRHTWLRAQNCSGCYGSPDSEQAPDRYPVLAILNASTHGFDLDYIYQDQMMELLGLPKTFFIKACEGVRGYSEVYLMKDRSSELPAPEKPVEAAPIFEDRSV